MNKKMTVLGGLLMAVVVTGYSVAGTFAKYTTSSPYTDKARAAEFNIEIGKANADQADLFGNSYSMASVEKSLAGIGTSGTVVAAKNADDKVVAPGTFGQYDFTVKGSAEVNYILKVDATVTNNLVYTYTEGEGADATTKTYSPIKFALVKQGDTATTIENIDDAEWVDAATVETELKALYAETDGTPTVFAANSTAKADSYTLFWKWDFNATDATSDKYDIEIAKLAANASDPLSVDLTVTAEQTQKTATVVTP